MTGVQTCALPIFAFFTKTDLGDSGKLRMFEQLNDVRDMADLDLDSVTGDGAENDGSGATPNTRGDLDLTLMVAGPGIFNQKAEGFDSKMIASISEPSVWFGERGSSPPVASWKLALTVSLTLASMPMRARDPARLPTPPRAWARVARSPAWVRF